jgi:hypothetical protein
MYSSGVPESKVKMQLKWRGRYHAVRWVSRIVGPADLGKFYAADRVDDLGVEHNNGRAVPPWIAGARKTLSRRLC